MQENWTPENFRDWMNRNGLAIVDAGHVLATRTEEVSDILNGLQPVSADIQSRANNFEAARFVSDDVDMSASIAEVSEKCRVCPQGVITGVSAASLRGWTTATTYVYFVATKPEHVGKQYPAGIIPVACENILDRVEVRQDDEGNWYRLADPVRTVVDAVRDDINQDRFSVEELVREAVAEGIDRKELFSFAQKQGSHAVERLSFYLSLIG